jgi:hypothetical protein
MMDQETDEVFLCLLTIEHPSLATPFRFVDDFVNHDSRGNTFLGYPFSITLPDDDPDRLPEAKLDIDNTDRQIVEAVRSLVSPPYITVEVVLAAQPDQVEISFADMRLNQADWDASVVSGALAYEDVLNEQFPGRSFSPDSHPGLF